MTTPRVVLAALLALSATATAASAAEVVREAVVRTPPAAVWQVVGPFCSIGAWFPAITSCSEEQIGGATHRRLVNVRGVRVLERVDAHDDGGRRFAYTLVEGPLPVTDDRAEMTVTEAGPGAARIAFRATYTPRPGEDEAAQRVVVGIFDGWLGELRRRFGE